MNYKVSVIKTFSAAHCLREYKGKCENLHGNNWKVCVTISEKKLNKNGMVMDFADVRMVMDTILEKLDHKYLNEVHPFSTINPTAENIAEYIFHQLGTAEIKVDSVQVWESDNAFATVSN